MKTTKSLFLTSLLIFAAALTSTASIVLNFDSVAAGGGVDASTYLSSFGITLTNVSPGSVQIFSDQNFYGSGVVVASSPHNFLMQNPGGAPNGATYTLNFSTPLTGISFTRIASPVYVTVAQWTATAYAGSTPVGSVGEGFFGGSEGSQIYTLSGPGITSLTITANGNNVAGIPSPPLDDLTLTPGPLVLSCTPGASVPNVLLPQLTVPLGFLPNPITLIPKPWQIQYSALELDFTEQVPADQGALCAAQSNVGPLTVSALFPPTGQTIPIAAVSASATITVFQPNSLPPLPTCVFFGPFGPGISNDCTLTGQFDASHSYLRWHSDGFTTAIFDWAPPLLSTGPLTFWVDLQAAGISGTLSMDDVTRAVEPYIHQQLIANLPAISIYTIIQDPGNVTLLVTDQSGRSTGIQNGTLDVQIPRSFYLPSPTYPAIVLANPAADSYRIAVTGTHSGDYSLSVATANLQTSAIQQAGVGGQIIEGGTATYILDLASMPASTMLFSGIFDGGGQRPRDVNKFLTYSNPTQNQTSLPAGTTAFPLQIVYGKTIIPSTFQAILNGVNISSMFSPTRASGQQVMLHLQKGKNVLGLSVDGQLADRIATDKDSLTFVVP